MIGFLLKNLLPLTLSGSYNANNMEEDDDFPEYGRQCELKEPWRGYHRGTIVGRNGYRFIVEFSSGARIEFYDDEIYFD